MLVASGVGVQKFSADLRVLPIEVIVLGSGFLLLLGVSGSEVGLALSFSFSQNGIGM